MRAQEFRVIDAHTHVIEHIAGLGRKGELRAVGGGRARWLDGEEAQLIPPGWGETSFTHDSLVRVLDEHGVSQAIMMQGSFYGFCNEYTFEAQERHRGRLYGMGTFDPYAFEAQHLMEHLIRSFRFRGLKFEVSRGFGLTGYHPRLRLDGAEMQRVWEFAEDEGFVVSLDLGTFGEPSLQVDELASTAKLHPGITFVVEHIFYPGRNHEAEVRSALERLAPLGNVNFTVASIPNSVMPEDYPFPSACRYIAIAKEVIGAGRILWGSDLPSVAVNAPYRELIDYVRDSEVFTDRELEQVYALNAERVYGL